MITLLLVHVAVAVLAPVLLGRLGCRAFLLLALAPLVTFGWTLAQTAQVLAGHPVVQRTPWIPALGVDASFRVDVLQWVLLLVVSGVGALVLIYCRWYFAHGEPPLRTGAVLVAFAGAMTGLVSVDDLIGLYVFWELTTVFSYLLVGHNPVLPANRRAALTALIVTTFGGLAMLAGVVLLGTHYGTFSLAAVLAGARETGVGAPIVIAAMVLVLVGALTKSALIPFHFWLPGAMAAPTPVSAYLHAAAMVKAGIYLVAVLAPVFAATPGWRPITLTFGAATMVLGGWRALRQFDIKVLLAYGTVSQLGFLVVLTGLGTRAAALGGLALLVAHALFKAALFLVVGIVDHSTGTRDLRRLSGVGSAMPVVTGVAVVAAASMAGLPPLLGFTSKEAGFEALSYLAADGDGTGLSAPLAALLAVALVVGTALTVAYSLRFLWAAFGRKPADLLTADAVIVPRRYRVSAGFVAAPFLLALVSIIGGFAGGPLTSALSGYADSFTVGQPSHGIALWHGVGAPLLMSAAAIAGGVILFGQRLRLARAQSTFPRVISAEQVYHHIMRAVDRLAVEVTARSSRGSLPLYLATILLVLLVLPGGALAALPHWGYTVRVADTWAQVFVGAVMAVAAILTAVSRGRLRAVILLGVTGYGVALLFVLHGAPDLAVTQVLVETVTLVIFALVLRKLPARFTRVPFHSSRWWRAVIALGVGVTVPLIAAASVGARTAPPVSLAYPEAAYEFGYGRNVVNVTLVDIRAWDTLGEISVLLTAATGVAGLIFVRQRYAPRYPRGTDRATPAHRNDLETSPDQPGRLVWLRGGRTLSPARRTIVFEVVTRFLFPVAIVVSVYVLLVGHNAPGGGFAGGLVAGMALMIRYLAAGAAELDQAAPVPAGRVLGAGLLVAVGSAIAPLAVGGRVLQSYDVTIPTGPLAELATPWGTLPLLGSPHLVTSTFFDVGVYLLVVGVMLDLARSLGSGVDLHALEQRSPTPQRTLRSWAADALRGPR